MNAAERWVRVEPGIVLDELNAQLKPHGLRFAPDISTASRATIGGMMANNSSGARQVLYGKTIDHVLEQEVAAVRRQRSRTSATAQHDEVDAACRATRSKPTAIERCCALAARVRGRNRPPLSQSPAPRGRLQPRRIHATRSARSTWRR